MKYEPLPELDTSFPDNDLGGMLSWIIVTLTVIAGLMWVCK